MNCYHISGRRRRPRLRSDRARKTPARSSPSFSLLKPSRHPNIARRSPRITPPEIWPRAERTPLGRPDAYSEIEDPQVSYEPDTGDRDLVPDLRLHLRHNGPHGTRQEQDGDTRGARPIGLGLLRWRGSHLFRREPRPFQSVPMDPSPIEPQSFCEVLGKVLQGDLDRVDLKAGVVIFLGIGSIGRGFG